MLDFESAALPPTGLPAHDHEIEPATKKDEKEMMYPVTVAPDLGNGMELDDEIEPTEEEYLTLRK